MISQSLYGDGIGTVTFNLYNSLKKQKIDVDIACFLKPSKESKQVQTILNNGDKVYHIPGLKSGGIFKYILNIRRLCKRKEYDVIHIHTGLFAWMTAIAVWPFCVKKRIAHAHGKTTHLNKKLQKIVVLPFRCLNMFFCNGFIGCSQESNTFAYGIKGIVIPNFVNTDSILSVPINTIINTRKTIADQDCIVLGFMGNIDDNKNVVFLPEVLYELQERGIPCKMIIMGNGVRFDAVKDKARELGVENHLQMLGKIENCNEVVQTIDYYISASKSEGMSMSMLEAQLSGKPCIVSANISNDSDLGIGLFYKVDTYDPKKWADKIINLYYSGIRAIDRKQAAKLVSKLGRDEKGIVSRLLRVYRK